MGLVDDNETEVVERGEEGGTGADDDLGDVGLEDLEPDFAAFGHGLGGVNEENTLTEGLLKDLDELAGKGDLGDEEDDGFLLLERVRGELEVDISLAATGDAAEETRGSWGLLEGAESGFLGGVEENGGWSEGLRQRGVLGDSRGLRGGFGSFGGHIASAGGGIDDGGGVGIGEF